MKVLVLVAVSGALALPATPFTSNIDQDPRRERFSASLNLAPGARVERNGRSVAYEHGSFQLAAGDVIRFPIANGTTRILWVTIAAGTMHEWQLGIEEGSSVVVTWDATEGHTYAKLIHGVVHCDKSQLSNISKHKTPPVIRNRYLVRTKGARTAPIATYFVHRYVSDANDGPGTNTIKVTQGTVHVISHLDPGPASDKTLTAVVEVTFLDGQAIP